MKQTLQQRSLCLYLMESDTIVGWFLSAFEGTSCMHQLHHFKEQTSTEEPHPLHHLTVMVSQRLFGPEQSSFCPAATQSKAEKMSASTFPSPSCPCIALQTIRNKTKNVEHHARQLAKSVSTLTSRNACENYSCNAFGDSSKVTPFSCTNCARQRNEPKLGHACNKIKNRCFKIPCSGSFNPRQRK